MKNITTLSGLNTADFEKHIDGKDASLFILKNNKGMEVTISNYGARIVSLVVPDAKGNPVDVVTGYSSIDDYLNADEKYMGAICGRYANRIANAQFELDGVVHKLTANNGANCLHGGNKGFHNVVWYMDKGELGNSVDLTYKSVDGEEGFPSTFIAITKYFLSDKNRLTVFFSGFTNEPTVVNMTNHAYFNLSGAGDSSIEDHILWINARYYLPTDINAIPLKESAAVEGTPMDFFTAPRRIGEFLHDNSFEQIVNAHGYDHTYELETYQTYDAINRCAARCVSPKTGIVMEMRTVEPGVQLYTGNYMPGVQPGKHGRLYPKHSAFCLETQHYPDSPNRPDYPSTVLTPDNHYYSETTFTFGIDENFK